MKTLRVALIGCGSITLQNHLPGLALCPDTRLVALCDADSAALERARQQTGVALTATRYEDIVGRVDVDAVIIATPNFTHAPIARAALAAGKHVLCEKPLALESATARELAAAADRAGVRHMTAFTYRFVPAMRYLAHLVVQGELGEIRHYRCCRLQDWGTRNLGWRQVRRWAGTGELGDMLSHRIDFAHMLVGPLRRLVADLRTFTPVRDGAPNDTDDWVGVLAEFVGGATGLLESSKLASGRNESWRSLDYVEINGSRASAVYCTARWNELQMGRAGGPGLQTVPVPREFWVWPGSPRDPTQGDPLVTFRYDQAFEFVDAVRTGRPCVPSFHEGARVQAVMDAIIRSAQTRQWVEVETGA